MPDHLSRLLTLAVAFTLVGGLAACGGDDNADGPTTTAPSGETTASSGETTVTSSADLTSYDTVQDLADALTEGGFSCTLDYEGLEQEGSTVSLCTVGSTQLQLSVFSDLNALGDQVTGAVDAGATLVYGANWSLLGVSEADAEAVAGATGGRVA